MRIAVDSYLIAILVAAGAIVALLVVWWLPAWQVSQLGLEPSAERRLELRNELRKTVAQIIGGLLVLAGFYFTAAQIAAALSKEVSERFTTAIGQLGSGQEALRIGGIYGLARIVRDAQHEQGPVLDVLSAFVRQHSRAENDTCTTPIDGSTRVALAVLSSIGRTSPTSADSRIDLGGAGLCGALLADASFRGARLAAAVLRDVDFRQADLRGANLQGSVLDHASLGGAMLDKADLTGASLKATDLRGADLDGALGLTIGQLRASVLDRTTKLPAAVRRELENGQF